MNRIQMMIEKGKISPIQGTKLIYIVITATFILFVPNFSAQAANNDAWITPLLGALPALVTLFLVCKLNKFYPGQTIFQYSEAILGRLLGKAIALSYVWFFVHMAAIVTRQYSDYLNTAFMTLTPLSVFNFSLIFLAGLAVLAGLENIARMNEFIILLVVSSLIIIFFLSIHSWEMVYLLPFLGNGPLPVLEGSLITAAWQSEIVVLAILLPYYTRPEKGFVSGSVALFLTSVTLAVGIAASISILGANLVAAFRFPFHLFVRTIDLGMVLTRLEAVAMVIWVAGVFIKISVFYYCAALGLGQIFGLREYRPVVLPLGAIIATFSMSLFADVEELSYFLSVVFPRYGLSLFLLGIPLLLFLLSLVKKWGSVS